VNSQMNEEWEACSAGSAPTGFVHPMALQTLAELGIQHHGWSKSMDEFRDQPFDLIVTVCEEASESCPVWLGKGVKIHMGFPDPAEATGSQEDVMNAFRMVRDTMLIKIPKILQNWPNIHI